MSPRSSSGATNRRSRRESPPINPLLVAAAAAVLVGVATVGVSWLTSPGLLLATLAVVASVAVLTQRLAQSQKALHWETRVLDPEAERGSDGRLSSLSQQVDLATRGNAESHQRVHTLLTDLATDRLRDHRGLEPSDPEAADLLGPDLTAYLAQRPTARLTTDQLHRHVQKLEELS
jgi:hypothetical protein